MRSDADVWIVADAPVDPEGVRGQAAPAGRRFLNCTEILVSTYLFVTMYLIGCT